MSKEELADDERMNKVQYSRTQVEKAGKRLVKDADVEKSLEVLSYWRSKHSCPLERAYEY
ncbi:MAG: hypothetical protein U9Q62_04950 [Campylobacterota bacterium]|nr:hypothetical protein [Campylobacterota bacterium]